VHGHELVNNGKNLSVQIQKDKSTHR
jgi:hypothetical protein